MDDVAGTVWTAIGRWSDRDAIEDDCQDFINLLEDDIVSAKMDDDGLTLALADDINNDEFHLLVDLQGFLDTAGVPVKLMGNVTRFYPKLAADVALASAEGFGFGDVAIWDHLHQLLEPFGEGTARVSFPLKG